MKAAVYAIKGQPCPLQPCPLRHVHDHQKGGKDVSKPKHAKPPVHGGKRQHFDSNNHEGHWYTGRMPEAEAREMADRLNSEVHYEVQRMGRGDG